MPPAPTTPPEALRGLPDTIDENNDTTGDDTEAENAPRLVVAKKRTKAFEDMNDQSKNGPTQDSDVGRCGAKTAISIEHRSKVSDQIGQAFQWEATTMWDLLMASGCSVGKYRPKIKKDGEKRTYRSWDEQGIAKEDQKRIEDYIASEEYQLLQDDINEEGATSLKIRVESERAQ